MISQKIVKTLFTEISKQLTQNILTTHLCSSHDYLELQRIARLKNT